MFVSRILFTSCYEAAYLVLFIRTTCKQGAGILRADSGLILFSFN